MKDIVLSLFRGYEDKSPTEVTLNQVMKLITEDNSIADLTEKYRYYIGTDKQWDAKRIKAKSLCFAIAVRFSGGKKQENICGWTGLSMVDFDHLDTDRIPELMKTIRADRHTLLAYITLSGRGIRIIFRIEGLGSDTQQNLKLYRQLFLKGNRYYAELTGCAFDELCKNPTRLCGVAYDTTLFYQPDAEPFVLTSEDEKAAKKTQAKKSATQFLNRAVKAAEQTLAERGAVYEPGRHNDYIMRLGYLLNGYGVEQSDAEQWAVKRFSDYDGNPASIIQSCYSHTDEHGKLPLYPRKENKEEKEGFYASVQDIEDFLDGQTRFRHNVITGKVEFLAIDNEQWTIDNEGTNTNNCQLSTVNYQLSQSWAEIDDRFVNSLWSRMNKQAKNVRATDLRAVLASEYVPLYNPFKVYFNSLPPWDGETDYIKKLTDTVTVKDGEQELFDRYFRMWLTGVVASMLNPETVNHEILVLIGPQGCYKSTWMNMLLPPGLRRYFYSKTNSAHINKDDLFSLTEFALICLEEIDVLGKQESNQLNALVTKPEVNERPAYGHYKERRPHLASFCGTTNNVQFLTDLSGSRRWLPFEVENILEPQSHPVDYTGVFSQAFALYSRGFRHYLSAEEVVQVNERNQRFEVPCIEMELIQMLFRAPAKNEQGVLFIPTAHIVHRLNAWVKQEISVGKVGQAMVKLGFEPVRKHGRRGYHVIELDGERIMANARLMAN